MKYARDFYDIPKALSMNDELRESIKELMLSQPMPGKVTEGEGRLDSFRPILISLANGEIELGQAFVEVGSKIPRYLSPHSSNNRVFPSGWEERLVRTQMSRFYNQALLEWLIENGENQCYIPHSEFEKPDSPCTIHFSDSKQETQMLYDLLIDSYSNGNWSREVKIPNHPHCTHVVVPILD